MQHGGGLELVRESMVIVGVIFTVRRHIMKNIEFLPLYTNRKKLLITVYGKEHACAECLKDTVNFSAGIFMIICDSS
jgi:hypothetical protein